MIVPMKKVSLVLLKKEQKQALEQLRKVGVLHLENLEGTGEKLATLKDAHDKMSIALSILGELTKAAKKAPAQAKKLSDDELIALSKKVVESIDQKKALNDAIAANVAELDRFVEWGQIDPSDFTYLHEKGIHLSFGISYKVK